jgi:hypothetical protein
MLKSQHSALMNYNFSTTESTTFLCSGDLYPFPICISCFCWVFDSFMTSKNLKSICFSWLCWLLITSKNWKALCYGNWTNLWFQALILEFQASEGASWFLNHIISQMPLMLISFNLNKMEKEFDGWSETRVQCSWSVPHFFYCPRSTCEIYLLKLK